MGRISTTILLLVFWPFFLKAQVGHVTGKVVDAATWEPLAFVNIVVNDSQEGSTSAIDGSFKVFSAGGIYRLTFSFVGYQRKEINVADYLEQHPKISPDSFVVRLKKSTLILKELVFNAGENPADKIIKQVVANKDENNPEKIKSFSYTSYNKFIVDADIDEKDLRQDSSLNKFLSSKYLFLMESVTKRKYLYPDRSKEIVIANRVSGMKNPMFTTLANSFQPFSFYKDFIAIGTKNYLNPISKGSFSKYFFTLEDSLYSYGHKVYIISFEPKKQDFDGLRGLLYINTFKYAVENVIAETSNLAEHLSKKAKSLEKPEPPMDINTNSEPPEVKPEPKSGEDGDFQLDFKIKIQQKYTLLDSTYWFPAQLNTDIEIGDASGGNGSLLKGKGRSYLSDIHLFDPLKPREFDRLAMEYEPNANKRDSTFWDAYRAEPLGPRGKETYHYLDSIGKKAKIDQTLMALGSLTTGKIPVGKLDIDMDRLLDFNMYEKVRLGFGMHTSNRLSSFFSLGGYGGLWLRRRGLEIWWRCVF